MIRQFPFSKVLLSLLLAGSAGAQTLYSVGNLGRAPRTRPELMQAFERAGIRDLTDLPRRLNRDALPGTPIRVGAARVTPYLTGKSFVGFTVEHDPTLPGNAGKPELGIEYLQAWLDIHWEILDAMVGAPLNDQAGAPANDGTEGTGLFGL